MTVCENAVFGTLRYHQKMKHRAIGYLVPSSIDPGPLIMVYITK